MKYSYIRKQLILVFTIFMLAILIFKFVIVLNVRNEDSLVLLILITCNNFVKRCLPSLILSVDLNRKGRISNWLFPIIY